MSCVQFRLVGESLAGHSADGITVPSGSVAYVTTGAPVPNGADACIKVCEPLPGFRAACSVFFVVVGALVQVEDTTATLDADGAEENEQCSLQGT